ncbi:MAG: GYD domain-containing protein [Thermomicrobiales bacterium]
MARYVVLIDFTDQGVRSAKETVQRSRQARADWERRGVRMEAVYWTLGEHDIVGIVDAPDDATLAATLLELAGAGNVRTKTMRAFDEGEMQAVLGQLG